MNFWGALLFCIMFLATGVYIGKITEQLTYTKNEHEDLIYRVSNTMKNFQEMKQELGIGGGKNEIPKREGSKKSKP